MPTSYKDIRDAIKNRIGAQWSATPIHWANTRKNPGTTAYIQPRVIFNTAEQVSMGPQGQNRIFGDVHANIFTPAGGGDDEAMTRVDSFRNLFPRGLVLPTASRSITFETPEAREPIEQEDWFQVPVFCPFYYDETP